MAYHRTGGASCPEAGRRGSASPYLSRRGRFVAGLRSAGAAFALTKECILISSWEHEARNGMLSTIPDRIFAEGALLAPSACCSCRRAAALPIILAVRLVEPNCAARAQPSVVRAGSHGDRRRVIHVRTSVAKLNLWICRCFHLHGCAAAILAADSGAVLRGTARFVPTSTIRKSVKRFCEEIMLRQEAKAR